MKKLVLLMIAAAPFYANAQGQQLQVVKTDVHMAPIAITNDVPVLSTEGEITPAVIHDVKRKAQPFDFIQVGQTYYDLQSNNSLGNRILLHSDGTVSLTWTTSPNSNDQNFPIRGSGFNYFDGTNWGTAGNARIETNTRTGWPSLGLLGNGDIYVMSHDPANGGFAFMTGPKDGSNFSTEVNVLDDKSVPGEDRAPIWGKTASSGDNIYVISTYTNTGGNADVIMAGVEVPMVYSRSTDNGTTWVDQNILLPDFDSTLYRFGSAEIYDITARDSVVAIVFGGIGEPLGLWKSTDYGANFTRSDVVVFPNPGVDFANWAVGDTLNSCDGSLEVILDNDLDAHVFFGGTIYYKAIDPNTGDTSTFYSPGSIRIMHWTEGMGEPQFCAGAIDRDGDGSYNITSETLSPLSNGAVPSTVLTSARYGNKTVATMPSAAVDANGNIFVIYSLAIEETYSPLNANYRDVMVTYSTDDGANWAAPQNITQHDYEEHVFAFAAERADNYLHMVWQADDIPGTNLTNNSTSASNHPINDNKIYYGAIPTSAIMNGEFGPHTLSTQEVQRAAELYFVGQSYPNPTSDIAQVTIFLLNGADLELCITDLYGKEVKRHSYGFTNAGNHILEIDATGLASGVYFYSISSGEHSLTRKLQVQ